MGFRRALLPACAGGAEPAHGVVHRHAFAGGAAQHAVEAAEPLAGLGIERPEAGLAWCSWRGVKVSCTRLHSVPSCQGARGLLWACSMRTGRSSLDSSPPNHRAFSVRPLASVQPAPKLPAMPPLVAKAARVHWLCRGQTPRPKSRAAKLCPAWQSKWRLPSCTLPLAGRPSWRLLAWKPRPGKGTTRFTESRCSGRSTSSAACRGWPPISGTATVMRARPGCSSTFRCRRGCWNS